MGDGRLNPVFSSLIRDTRSRGVGIIDQSILTIIHVHNETYMVFIIKWIRRFINYRTTPLLIIIRVKLPLLCPIHWVGPSAWLFYHLGPKSLSDEPRFRAWELVVRCYLEEKTLWQKYYKERTKFWTLPNKWKSSLTSETPDYLSTGNSLGWIGRNGKYEEWPRGEDSGLNGGGSLEGVTTFDTEDSGKG